MPGMKKTLIAALLAALLLSIFSMAYADSADDFSVEVVGNCWSKNVSMGGSALYTPYLKLNIKNQQDYSESRIVVKVVFYDESEKSLWSDETDYLVSSGDDPLKSGYSKTAFIRSSVGYRSQISASSLPFVKAEVYINDDYYGFIDINRWLCQNQQHLQRNHDFAEDDPRCCQHIGYHHFPRHGWLRLWH